MMTAARLAQYEELGPVGLHLVFVRFFLTRAQASLFVIGF